MEAAGTYTIFVNPQYPSKYATTLEQELEARTGREVTVGHLYLMLGPTDGLDYFNQQHENIDSLRRALEVRT
jgi:ABC-type Zn uptake system ZnuABC Zn-binding protein ZnuA